jgi:hypothetical protein
VCFPSKRKSALQFGSQVIRFGTDLDGLGDLTFQPAVPFFRRTMHAPTNVGDGIPDFAQRSATEIG